QSAAVEIPGRVFGTRFFPRLCKLEYTLQTAEQSHQGVTAAFALYAADFTSWTFAGEPTVAWQVPMSLSEGAYRVGPYANEAKEELNEILKAASCFVVTKAALRDLIRAKVLMDNKGNAPSPLTLVRSISDALVFFSENREGAAAMFELLPRETVRKIKDSAWYKEIDAQIPLQIENPARRQNFSGLNFIGPNIFNGNTFLISETPVSRSLFENFLNENPEYQEHKTDYFPDEVANLPEIDRNAVTGITWFAAEAFCKWLSLRLPPIMSGNTIRLPTEDEWFWASNHISNTQGSVWEWCANPYAPINIKASPKAIEAVGSPERSLRRLNSNDSKERASLPPDLSSPFVTFRLVIAPTAAITPKE
ncbi:MAG: formylglycine-generating enzyme family protein, partial [Treponema sp.]|nr:formylglycine-generating enzyme family protein [Treponema sp.]